MAVELDTDREFTRFVHEHTSALMRTAYLMTGDGPAAEELVQDTLVRLYPKWHLVQAAEVPLAYVRRSLVNGFVNHTRRASRRETAVDYLPELPDDNDHPGRYDDRDQLWSLLRTLPHRQRAALVLRYFHDLPDEEIGTALGCRIGTVRSLVSRGLAAMRASSEPGRNSA
jgi:RNA polymerase sigma-70 factor (sigma-E family)